MFLIEPIIQAVLTWLANFLGGLLSNWIKEMGARKDIEQKAHDDQKRLEDSKTPDERDHATDDLARDSF